ncbi:LysR family transcriptional regulator [Alkalibacillus silvisoli]|uniref:LysR family transcriptional regulator n=1 Tax=Alkalibacillus silvisoli TaxID=392823 RepID=A0ABN1A7I8_9BACI
MEFRDWEILKTLNENKNITKTAHSLYITQPTISKRMRKMESEFGFKIITREARGISFTPKGEYIANYAEEMLIRLRQINEDVLNMDNNFEGTLRIGASKLVTRYKLPAILSEFQKKYPKVKFKVITSSSLEIEDMVQNKTVHVGIGRGDYSNAIEKHMLFEESINIVSKNELTLDELPDLPRIDYHSNYKTRAVIDDWWIERFSKPPQVGMEVGTTDTCKQMVMHGLGYAVLPSIVLENSIHFFRIPISMENGNPLKRRAFLLYQRESLELNIIDAFVNFVKEFDF